MTATLDTIRRLYVDEKKSSIVIAAEIGRSKFWVLTQLRKMKVVRPLKESLAISEPHRTARTRKGSDCPQWRGGIRHNSAGGYTSVMVPDHPNADPAGYVLEHRLVMERHLGRLLGRREHVHHINGIKSDNRLENLELLSQSDHMSIHATERERHAEGHFGKGSRRKRSSL